MSTLTEQLQHKIDFKTKPLGSLGMLEKTALQIGLIQQTLSPVLCKPAMLVFAADHGLADEKVSPFPKEVTWQMVMNYIGGGASISVFSRLNGFDMKIIDAGVDYDFPAELPVVNAKIGRGTRNMRKEPAMSTGECEAALAKGAEMVALEAEKGCNVVAFGEMGIGNTSASALLMHRFLNLPIEECIGAGAGSLGDHFENKRRVITEVAGKYNPQTPLETLATFGGFEIAMMAGGMLEAARRRMIVLVDGFIATAAALSAVRLDPSCRECMIFCHSSNEQGHRKMLADLKASPLLQLELRLGEGTGAALAYPLVQAAVAFLNEMASFEEAGVSNQD